MAAGAQQRRRLCQCGRRHDLDAIRERRLSSAIRRHDHAPDAPPSQRHDHRQQARHGAQVPAQRQLAEHRPPARSLDLLRTDHDAEGYRQIERRATFAQVGGRQVHRNAPWWVVVAAVPDRPPDSLPRFLQGSVREPNDREARQTWSDIDFDANDAAIEAVNGGR